MSEEPLQTLGDAFPKQERPLTGPQIVLAYLTKHPNGAQVNEIRKFADAVRPGASKNLVANSITKQLMPRGMVKDLGGGVVQVTPKGLKAKFSPTGMLKRIYGAKPKAHKPLKKHPRKTRSDASTTKAAPEPTLVTSIEDDFGVIDRALSALADMERLMKRYASMLKDLQAIRAKLGG